ncbi:hypothetical protein FKP32DRAFT_323715 [Trametes sanguinea]|nr:hypothetical protein FKP32DRAFT_323715 [Trametes sanguinea]
MHHIYRRLLPAAFFTDSCLDFEACGEGAHRRDPTSPLRRVETQGSPVRTLLVDVSMCGFASAYIRSTGVQDSLSSGRTPCRAGLLIRSDAQETTTRSRWHEGCRLSGSASLLASPGSEGAVHWCAEQCRLIKTSSTSVIAGFSCSIQWPSLSRATSAPLHVPHTLIDY